MGGKIEQVKPEDTSFWHRKARFLWEVKSIWANDDQLGQNVEWGYELGEAMKPHDAARTSTTSIRCSPIGRNSTTAATTANWSGSRRNVTLRIALPFSRLSAHRLSLHPAILPRYFKRSSLRPSRRSHEEADHRSAIANRSVAVTCWTAGSIAHAAPPIVLSPAIPGDVNVTAKTVSIDAFQPDFDVYSWNTFIALNWPPGPDGNGDPKQTIGKNGDNDTVWEHYRDVSDVFLPGGARPTWNGP